MQTWSSSSSKNIKKYLILIESLFKISQLLSTDVEKVEKSSRSYDIIFIEQFMMGMSQYSVQDSNTLREILENCRHFIAYKV